jgi:hypothetical protein
MSAQPAQGIGWRRIEELGKCPTFEYHDEYDQITMSASVGGSSQPIVGMALRGEVDFNGDPITCDPAVDLCINVLLDPGDDCCAHFCNLQEHIEQMQALATSLREWDQKQYLE